MDSFASFVGGKVQPIHRSKLFWFLIVLALVVVRVMLPFWCAIM